MSYFSRYDKGDWATICDACGRKFKASQLRQRWDGLKTCEDDWEPRQPQDFVRGVADYQAPPFTRPEQQDQFIPFSFTQSLFALLGNKVTLTYKQVYTTLKTVTTNAVTSAASLITAIFRQSRTVNGNSINKQTLG